MTITQEIPKYGNSEFFSLYFSTICGSVSSVDFSQLRDAAEIMLQAKAKGGKIIFAGNGGSAAMAS